MTTRAKKWTILGIPVVSIGMLLWIRALADPVWVGTICNASWWGLAALLIRPAKACWNVGSTRRNLLMIRWVGVAITSGGIAMISIILMRLAFHVSEQAEILALPMQVFISVLLGQGFAYRIFIRDIYRILRWGRRHFS